MTLLLHPLHPSPRPCPMHGDSNRFGPQDRQIDSPGHGHSQHAAPHELLTPPQLHPGFAVAAGFGSQHRHTESFIQGCISASNSLEPLKCCLGAPASLFILLCPAGTSFAFLCPAISQKLCYKTSTGPRAMNRSLFVEVTFFCFLSFFFFPPLFLPFE